MTRRSRLLVLVIGLAAIGTALAGGDGRIRARQATPATQAEQRDEGRALVDLLFVGAGFLILTGGGVALYGLWYARGRDPHAGLVADFIPQPPDDLPPGPAGTLLDERADHCDVVATLVDLGRRAVVRIAEVAPPDPPRPGGRDFALTLVQPDAPVAPFEREIVVALFGAERVAGTTTRLSRVQRGFAECQPFVKEKLYAELVARGYFPRSPEATRRWWRNAGIATLVTASVAGASAAILVSPFAWFPTVAAVGLALVVIRLSGSMPRKTAAGAEAAARWRAFRRYLASITKYERVAEATGIFDRYLPYAVAFGVDRAWIATFAAVGTAAPAWYDPAGGLDTGAADWLGSDLGTLPISTGDWNLGGLPDLDMPNLSGVGLQQVGDLLGGSLQLASDGLGAMLDAAGSVFESIDFNP